MRFCLSFRVITVTITLNQYYISPSGCSKHHSCTSIKLLAFSILISIIFALDKARSFDWLKGQCMNKRIFASCIVSNRTFEVKWILLCYVIASFASLFFLSISSSEQVDLVNGLCYLIWHVWDLFLKFYICNDYNLQPSSVFSFHLVQPFVFSSLFLSYC